ncbi:MAG: hypothetical protein LBS26_02115 [Campylobacteraceae bacterium]|jgi:hypothetical protein|nr:hypothetical protein [Campylobacteraceae bacterium]
MNNIINNIVKMASIITETAWSILEGLKKNDIILLEKAVEHLSAIDINANKIDNEIISLIPILCKNKHAARELISYIRIINEFAQTAVTLKYFCKYMSLCMYERSFIATKEPASQLLQSSIDAFIMSAELMENRDNIEDIFRKIKIKRLTMDDLYLKIEKTIIGLDTKLTINCTKILNAVEKLDDIFKSAITVTKIILLIRDGGKLRIY